MARVPSNSSICSSNRAPTPDALKRLFMHADWAAGRSTEDIARLIQDTSVYATAWSGEGKLIGYARALSDGQYRAAIDDVVVDPAYRGRGVGQELMRNLLSQLEGVEEVRLVCGEGLVPFYQSLGFERDPGPNLLVRTPATEDDET